MDFLIWRLIMKVGDFVRVQYGDVTDWIDIEDLEIVNASR